MSVKDALKNQIDYQMTDTSPKDKDLKEHTEKQVEKIVSSSSDEKRNKYIKQIKKYKEEIGELKGTIGELSSENERVSNLLAGTSNCFYIQIDKTYEFKEKCKSLEQTVTCLSTENRDLKKKDKVKTMKIKELLDDNSSLLKRVAELEDINSKLTVENKRLFEQHQPFLKPRTEIKKLIKQKKRAFELYQSDNSLSFRKIERLLQAEFNPTKDERVQVITHKTISAYIKEQLK